MSGKTQAICIHKRLWLYRQRGSRCWYARVTFGGVTKAKSTGTDDLKIATERAHAFYIERVALCGRGEILNGKTAYRRFDKLADDFLELKKSELTESGWRNLRNLVISRTGPAFLFHGKDVGDITTDGIRNLVRYAEAQSTKGSLSPHTKKRYVSAISGILRLAAERQLISAIPPMPRYKAKDSPRPCFTDSEYRCLCRTAHQQALDAERNGHLDEAGHWHELRNLIAFLVNTFLRPSEWMGLRHRHITVDRSDKAPHLRIALELGKTGSRSAVSMPSAVKVYDRIVARNCSEPDGYLFLNQYQNRRTAQEKMGRRFRQLLDLTGLRFDPFGHARTLYSLRHTALMLRLLNADGDLDLLTLAKAAGTSVQMLERFYLSHHAPAMKLEALQSFKRRPSA